MSISAAIVGAAVLLLRAVNIIPRRFIRLLWLAPFLRMTFPFFLNSDVSILKPFAAVGMKTVYITELVPYDYTLSPSTANYVQFVNSYRPIIYKEEVFEEVLGTAGVIWLAVAAALLTAIFALYFLTLFRLRKSVRLYGNVYVSDRVSSPAVYGVIRPKIILPESYIGRDVSSVLLHERTHIRHGDNLLRLFAFAAAAVNWFNPLAWLFLTLFLCDVELACDERAVSKLGGEDEKKRYAANILECVEAKGFLASAFGGAPLKKRITRILGYKKFHPVLSAVLWAAAAFVLVALSTNAF